MTFALSELQEFGQFVLELDARGRAEQALEGAQRIARDAHRALGVALNDYRCKRDAYAAAKRVLEALA
jgi:adenylate cyclase class IV